MHFTRLLSPLVVAIILAMTPPAVSASGDTLSHVQSIFVERLGCYGTCPVYDAMFEKDGTLTYNGRRHVAVLGKHTARVDFSRIAEWYSLKSGQMMVRCTRA